MFRRVFLVLVAMCGVSARAEECSTLCSGAFVNGCMRIKSYSVCRTEIDNGVGPLGNVCAAYCTDSLAMQQAMSSSTSTVVNGSDTTGTCTDSCSTEFVNNCFPFRQSYVACRTELDNSVGPLSQACVPGCSDTVAMAALQSVTDSGVVDVPTQSMEESCFSVGTDGSTMLPLTSNAQGNVQELPCICRQGSAHSNARGTLCKVTFDVPRACDAEGGKSCPLVFFFHGHGGNIANSGRILGQYVHAANQFIGVYVQGAAKPEADNAPGWNTGSESIPGGNPTIDDAQFVLDIAAFFAEAYGHSARIYAYGYSNGAAMAQKLGVNGAIGFAGIAAGATQLLSKPTQAGPGVFNYNIPSAAASTVPLGVITFHGDADTTIPYEGGTAPPAGNAANILLDSAENSNMIWANNNGCSDASTMGTQSPVGLATHSVWDCPATSPSEHYKVAGAGHAIGNIDGKALEELSLEFFAKIEVACAAVAGSCPSLNKAVASAWMPAPSGGGTFDRGSDSRGENIDANVSSGDVLNAAAATTSSVSALAASIALAFLAML